MKTKNLILLEAYMKTKISQAQGNLREGQELDTDELAEGIFDGLKNIFSKNSTVGRGATDGIQAARDATNRGIEKGKKIAGDIKSDYQVGSGTGEMKKIAANLAKLDTKFAESKQDIAKRFVAINKERAQFSRVYKAAKIEQQDSLMPVYKALAKALKINTNQPNWVDSIDAMIKQKGLS